MSSETIQTRRRNTARITSQITTAKSHGFCWLALICACCFLWSCSDSPPKQKPVEAPPPAAATAVASDQPAPPQQLTAPDLNKVQEVVKRVFKDAALVDTTRKPSFIAGDFNGDQSQDLAVVIKAAAGKTSEMNEQPSWILKDPFDHNEPAKARPQITEDEVLLAVIHGYGPSGWNDPQATQTFLLKNAVGSGMQPQTGKEFLAANHGKKLPRISGDLIGEVLRGSSGYLYYDNATYSWYNQKTFKGEQQPGMVHSGMKK